MNDDDLLDAITNFDDHSGPKKQLPNAQATFILGIVSIVPGCLCSCLGIVLGIIGLVIGSNASKIYDADPNSYTEEDYKQVKNGKTLSIVGIVLTTLKIILSFIFNIGSITSPIIYETTIIQIPIK